MSPLKGFPSLSRVAGFLLFAFLLSLQAQQPAHRLVFNATGPAPAPKPVPTHLGANRAPDGNEIAVNSQYLTLNGKPWIPVMGEFHFSRYPEAYWEEEILKMKASGVQIISTYVFWIHIEEVEGQFDWSGQRDLREFAELCQKHGMLLFVRIGPWDHGEARNGGLPDWVLKNSPVRSDNPIFLSEVRKFYEQIGEQLHGLLWKDGGPVIGVQIENEYSMRGPGKGREYLATLKKLAIESGLDVPLYTVTGWDNAVVPDDLFLPVYGGYPAAPWDRGTGPLPPSEVYAFRFGSRVTGDMGAPGRAQSATAQTDKRLWAETPFLTAEVGGGIQNTYHRRPVLAPKDIEAMVPVMIGSGVNLLGYYMYQGGENPDGKLTTLQESQRTGYPNDLPVKDYDFQAPLGAFGEIHPQLLELKLDHYFLNDFGKELAPEQVIEPDPHPSGPADMSVVRASLRIKGQSGFLFVNNYVREHTMPSWPETQFEIKFPGKVLFVPAAPFTLPANSFFYWPVNLNIDGVTLRYSTAQPVLKVRSNGNDYVFFAAIPGIPVEFAFPSELRQAVKANSGAVSEDHGLLRVQNVNPGRGIALTLRGQTGNVDLVVLSPGDAKRLWRVDVAGRETVLLTRAQVFSEGKWLVLRQIGNADFDLDVFRPSANASRGRGSTAPGAEDDQPFFRISRNVTPQRIDFQMVKTRDFGKAPTPELGPKFPWRKGVAMAPSNSSFAQAAAWKLTFPPNAMHGVSDIYLSIQYQGDEARLLAGSHLLTDDYFNGTTWQIGLKRFLRSAETRTFTLEILPLSDKAPIFFEPGFEPKFNKDGQAGSLESIDAVPEYEVRVAP